MTSNIISSKIVGQRVKQVDVVPTVTPAPLSENPLTMRIDGRPVGSLQAVSEKVVYNTQEGRKKLYLIVSFMPVEGVVDGTPVTVERPVEFFIPSGQMNSEQQWITASMRSLSLAARGGYITQALQDLRKVMWDKGPVRCGTNQHGKPMYHDSEVAAIAAAIQKILVQRGFLTPNGEQVPLEEMMVSTTSIHHTQISVAKTGPMDVVNDLTEAFQAATKHGDCPECGGGMTLLDGCPTCTDCGYSKCG